MPIETNTQARDMQMLIQTLREIRNAIVDMTKAMLEPPPTETALSSSERPTNFNEIGNFKKGELTILEDNADRVVMWRHAAAPGIAASEWHRGTTHNKWLAEYATFVRESVVRREP